MCAFFSLSFFHKALNEPEMRCVQFNQHPSLLLSNSPVDCDDAVGNNDIEREASRGTVNTSSEEVRMIQINSDDVN